MIHNTTCTCPAVSFLAVAGCCKVQYSILHLQEEAGSVTSPVECLQSLQPLEYSVKSNYVGNNDEVVDIAESWRRCLLELQTKVHTKVRNHRENYKGFHI